jgi:hypothetical protein
MTRANDADFLTTLKGQHRSNHELPKEFDITWQLR